VLASRSFPKSLQRRLYAGLQIFGGGQFVMMWMNGVGDATHTVAALIFLTVMALVGLASAAIALIYLDGGQRAKQWCLFFWAIQIPTFACPWASYRFLSGAEVRVGLSLSPGRLFEDFQLGAGIVARVAQEGSSVYFGVNALALAAVVFLARRASTAPAEAQRAV
jgi:hypothetical protein